MDKRVERAGNAKVELSEPYEEERCGPEVFESGTSAGEYIEPGAGKCVDPTKDLELAQELHENEHLEPQEFKAAVISATKLHSSSTGHRSRPAATSARYLVSLVVSFGENLDQEQYIAHPAKNGAPSQANRDGQSKRQGKEFESFLRLFDTQRSQSNSQFEELAHQNPSSDIPQENLATEGNSSNIDIRQPESTKSSTITSGSEKDSEHQISSNTSLERNINTAMSYRTSAADGRPTPRAQPPVKRGTMNSNGQEPIEKDAVPPKNVSSADTAYLEAVDSSSSLAATQGAPVRPSPAVSSIQPSSMHVGAQASVSHHHGNITSAVSPVTLSPSEPLVPVKITSRPQKQSALNSNTNPQHVGKRSNVSAPRQQSLSIPSKGFEEARPISATETVQSVASHVNPLKTAGSIDRAGRPSEIHASFSNPTPNATRQSHPDIASNPASIPPMKQNDEDFQRIPVLQGAHLGPSSSTQGLALAHSAYAKVGPYSPQHYPQQNSSLSYVGNVDQGVKNMHLSSNSQAPSTSIRPFQPITSTNVQFAANAEGTAPAPHSIGAQSVSGKSENVTHEMEATNILRPTTGEAALPSNLVSAPPQGQHAMQAGNIPQGNVIVTSPHSVQELQPSPQSSSSTGRYTSFSNQGANLASCFSKPVSESPFPSVSETPGSPPTEKHKMSRGAGSLKKQATLTPADPNTSSASTGIRDSSTSKVEISIGSLLATRVTSTSKRAAKQVSRFVHSIPSVRIENMPRLAVHRQPASANTVFLRYNVLASVYETVREPATPVRYLAPEEVFGLGLLMHRFPRLCHTDSQTPQNQACEVRMTWRELGAIGYFKGLTAIHESSVCKIFEFTASHAQKKNFCAYVDKFLEDETPHVHCYISNDDHAIDKLRMDAVQKEHLGAKFEKISSDLSSKPDTFVRVGVSPPSSDAI